MKALGKCIYIFLTHKTLFDIVTQERLEGSQVTLKAKRTPRSPAFPTSPIKFIYRDIYLFQCLTGIYADTKQER